MSYPEETHPYKANGTQKKSFLIHDFLATGQELQSVNHWEALDVSYYFYWAKFYTF